MTFDDLWKTLPLPGEYDAMDACDQGRWRMVVEVAFSARQKEIDQLRAALKAACEEFGGWMNLPIEPDQVWIDQEKGDLALMDQVRIALGLKPWLEAHGIALTPNE